MFAKVRRTQRPKGLMCSAGLWNFIYPVSIDRQCIGVLVGGMARIRENDTKGRQKLRESCRQNNLNAKTFEKKYDDIPEISKDEMDVRKGRVEQIARVIAHEMRDASERDLLFQLASALRDGKGLRGILLSTVDALRGMFQDAEIQCFVRSPAGLEEFPPSEGEPRRTIRMSNLPSARTGLAGRGRRYFISAVPEAGRGGALFRVLFKRSRELTQRENMRLVIMAELVSLALGQRDSQLRRKQTQDFLPRFTTCTDLRSAVKHMLSTLVGILGARRGCVWMRDTYDPSTLRKIRSIAFGRQSPKQLRLRQRTVFNKVADKCEVRVLHKKDKEFGSLIRQVRSDEPNFAMALKEARTIAILPFQVGLACEGLILLTWLDKPDHTRDVQQIGMPMLKMISNRVSNMRASPAHRQHWMLPGNHENDAEIRRALGDLPASARRELCRLLAIRAGELTGSARACVRLLDMDEHVLGFAQSYETTKGKWPKKFANDQFVLPTHYSAAGRAIETGVTFCIPDLKDERDARCKYFYAVQGCRVRSHASIPLLGKEGRIVGVISLDSDRVNAFSPTTIAVTESLASAFARLLDGVSGKSTVTSIQQELAVGGEDRFQYALKIVADAIGVHEGTLFVRQPGTDRFERFVGLHDDVRMNGKISYYVAGLGATSPRPTPRADMMPQRSTTIRWRP